MIVLTTLTVSLFAYLGYWQIQRGAQKEAMVRADAARASQGPIPWSPEQKAPLQYQRIKVTGQYVAPIFLLDNQHHQHQFGYNALSPLLLDNGMVVLIDRGWIIGDNTRRFFPEITTPKSLIQLQGSAYYPSNKQWVLGSEVEKKTDQLILLERLNTKTAGQILQKKVYPFIIRLDKEEAHGFLREWAIVSMPPERHLAYAVQWFAMAAVVFIIFVALNLKKHEKTKN
jgi:surfeit locus 1 family protein